MLDSAAVRRKALQKASFKLLQQSPSQARVRITRLRWALANMRPVPTDTSALRKNNVARLLFRRLAPMVVLQLVNASWVRVRKAVTRALKTISVVLMSVRENLSFAFHSRPHQQQSAMTARCRAVRAYLVACAAHRAWCALLENAVQSLSAVVERRN